MEYPKRYDIDPPLGLSEEPKPQPNLFFHFVLFWQLHRSRTSKSPAHAHGHETLLRFLRCDLMRRPDSVIIFALTDTRARAHARARASARARAREKVSVELCEFPPSKKFLEGDLAVFFFFLLRKKFLEGDLAVFFLAPPFFEKVFGRRSHSFFSHPLFFRHFFRKVSHEKKLRWTQAELL